MSEESNREIEPEANVAPAPTPQAPKLYPFKVLAAFSTAVRMARRNFGLFLLLACVLVVPSLVTQYVHPLFGMLSQSVLSAVATAVVSYAVVMDMNGTRPSIGACIAQGFRSFWRVLGVSVFSGLVIVVALMALVVPGIIVALMFFVIVPVTVIEGVGLDAAMKRSRELTSGRKGDLFALAMLVGLFFVPAVVVAVSLGLGPSAQILWFSAFSGVFAAFMSVLSAVVYVVLRQMREGTQVPELATAFARIRK